MQLINLKPYGFAKVDDEDIERVNLFRWYLTKTHPKARTYYIQGRKRDGEKRLVYLHRYILGLTGSDKDVVDHKNGDGLDNRKENLSYTTKRNNLQNTLAHRNGKLVGVSKRPYNRFEARIIVSGKYIYLGCYSSEKEAHEAYKKFSSLCKTS
mgnify:CR=1 FL=1